MQPVKISISSKDYTAAPEPPVKRRGRPPKKPRTSPEFVPTSENPKSTTTNPEPYNDQEPVVYERPGPKSSKRSYLAEIKVEAVDEVSIDETAEDPFITNPEAELGPVQPKRRAKKMKRGHSGIYYNHGTNHDKPYECKLCDKSMRDKHSMARHVLAVHLKLKPYRCGICNVQAICKYSLKFHLKSKHNTEEEAYIISDLDRMDESERQAYNAAYCFE